MNYLIKFFGIFLIISSIFQNAFAESSTTKGSSKSLKTEKLDIKVTNAYVYVPVRHNKNTTAFFTIKNNSNTDVSVERASSNSVKQIQLMPAVLLISAHRTLELKPSGPYLQLNELKTNLTTGDELHLTLDLSNGQKLRLVALAKSAYDQPHSR